MDATSLNAPVPTKNTLLPTVELILTVEASNSPTSVATSTASLSPTADPSHVSDYLLGLYEKRDCTLPCWWGITPGETAWEDVYNKFSPLSNVLGPGEWKGMEYYGFEFNTINGKLPVDDVRYTIWIQEKKVFSILSNIALVTKQRDASLAEALKSYGKPGEIWLVSIRWGGMRPDAYINLYYPSKGIWLFWQNLAEVQDDNKLTICPTNWVPEYKNMTIFLFSPESHLQFEDAWDIMTGRFDEKLGKYGPYGPLEKFTHGFDTTDFYETYLNAQSTKCFDINPTK